MQLPARFCISALVAVLLSACTSTRYYAQAARGQFEISSRGRPISAVRNSEETPEQVRSQLALALRILEFSATDLALEPGDAYTHYADLGREHVVWNLVAAPELDLTPKKWRYPIVGKLSYRGYFSEEAALAAARKLDAQGYDTVVGGVRAYSTLGWFRDPILNTFIEDKETLLAELLFHELTHRRLFRKGETAFNEALATAFSHEGVRRWLRAQGKTMELSRYEALLARRAVFYDQNKETRRKLGLLYASELPRAEKLRQKKRLLAELQAEFRHLHRRFGTRRVAHWLDQPLTNAHLAASATYLEHLPTFQALLSEHTDDLDAFFKAAEKLPRVDE